MSRSLPRPRLAVGAAVAALAFLAGCGDDDSGSDPGADESSASESASEEEFTELSGKEISDISKADMLELESLRYAGELVSNGAPLGLDVQASTDGSCAGSLDLNGGVVELLAADGKAWYRPDEAFWRANAGQDADQVIAAVGDKWVVDTRGDFSQFCDLSGFLGSIFEDDGSESTYEVVGTEELDGQEVVEVTNTDADGAATGYVLVEGEHYLVKVERTEGDNPGELNFSAFNEDVTVEAPAEDEQIDLSQQG